jgi:hypothetical protein
MIVLGDHREISVSLQAKIERASFKVANIDKFAIKTSRGKPAWIGWKL